MQKWFKINYQMKNKLKIFRSALFFLGTLFILNGCTSNDTNKQETAKPDHSVDTVTLNLMKFNPAIVNAKLGDTIVWMNNDLVDHNVTSFRDKFIYSDTLKVGSSWKWIVTDSASYFCSIHPTMTGKILIK